MRPSEPGARRALVTGIAGFTGRHLAARLEAHGYDVWGTVALGTDVLGDPLLRRWRCVKADLLDVDSLHAAVADARPHAVVHLAARAHVAHGNPQDTYLVNVVGTRNLLASLAGLDARPHAVLLASSANVYGNASTEVLDESAPPQPANDYAVSKLAMEYMAKLWLDRLPIVIARPFNYTGVGQSEAYLLPKLVAHYARGEPRIALGNLDVSRDFSDVRDVVDAYARLIDAAPVGETFNVCAERGYALKEVLAMLARIAGYVIDVSVDPRFVRASEVKKLVGSRRKLRAAIGDARRTPLDETLRWMYGDMRAALGAREDQPAS
ncbi:NAD-dependent epimerase/dehydratase family protein [Burkholderia pseudomallei]|uniref:NAD-dependent epimerase/dehydratase family protein n=1 Tax=Burkholderia pseudomallei TaxID=28450 RepID=UPI000F068B12|nr:NAD-dependent epimerase/dehydratase family protein [Burkholderia pseudomallei]VBC72346.1 GDP-6-deoxy-D-lyxo-4-hexulose reductase [Burkholderia pseudomallei]VBC78747.1 GDP-6-deoxy-D-lyxo-4-hexulose reductase [Burkholderia pseudomallei]